MWNKSCQLDNIKEAEKTEEKKKFNIGANLKSDDLVF